MDANLISEYGEPYNGNTQFTPTYNTKDIKPKKGSAIFIHLTKNYGKTLGCIALKKTDFLILLRVINKKTKIKIN